MIKVHKFLIAVVAITSFAVLYVWQQTEIFRLAYAGQKKALLYQDLVDRNNYLRYNIERSASLVRLGNDVIEDKAFEMPAAYYRLVSARNPHRSLRAQQQMPQRESLVFRLFGIKRQAEAKTINP
mgnify:CR=1 FL=1